MHKSTGFGDTVEKFTRKTGIKTIVDHVSQGLNIPCGCEIWKFDSAECLQ